MKLRVGNIEMDSEGGVNVRAPADRRGRSIVAHNVVVTGPPQSPASPPTATRPLGPSPSPPTPSPPRLRAMSWLGFGAAAAVAVTVLVAVPLTSPLALGLSIPVLGLATGGLVARRAAARLERERDLRRAARADALAAPVEAALRASHEPLTVEALVARLSASEADVVEGLARLVECGRATEDLDLDTGHFLYRWGSDQLDAHPPLAALDIRDRAALLEDAEPSPHSHARSSHAPNSHEGTS